MIYSSNQGICAKILTVDRNVNENFKFNQETEFVPILGMIESELNATHKSDGSNDTENIPKAEAAQQASSIQDNHHPALLSLLSQELSVAPEEIHDFELYASIDTIGSVAGEDSNHFRQITLRHPTFCARRH